METYIAILASAGIALHLALRYGFGVSAESSQLPLYATLALGGVPLVVDLCRKLLAHEFGSDLLAGMSIVTAVLLGQYLVGAIVVLMLSGGTALEHFAARRASSVLEALAKRMPSTAHRQNADGLAEVDLGSIQVGDRLVVFPHEICPTDGVVVEGHGVMDEAYLTGEPYEMSKAPGSQVLSGAVNGETALTLEATRLPVDSRYAKIVRVMQASEQNRPRLRRLGDQLGAWYTPAAVAVAGFAWLISGHSQRFLAVMVVATPCPLLIAIPVAVIGAISLAARHSIIIRNPAVLEQVDGCRTLIFDKTGTLTYGRPSLTEIVCAPGFTRKSVLRAAASLEQYSKHPLAGAILRAAAEEGLGFDPVARVSERPGEGLRGIAGGKNIHIAGRDKTRDAQIPAAAGGLECALLMEGAFAALLRFHDAPRQESGSFVSHLAPRHRVTKIMLVSGDREQEVRYLAQAVGIAEVRFGQSPEEKVAIVQEEAARAKTLFVGDGINDAPAMLAATVGVAFGVNSDVTSEAADAVVLEASLQKVDQLIHIGRRLRSIALQSAVGGMALSMLGMLLAAVGRLSPIEGAVAQEIIDLAAVLNALRVALPSRLTDF
ncbi:MAG TPA: heavy metal translocating P-type ATPase [Terriglobia bacterium]|nr:heavy metal translocating P-type ATPase [Terriglobia bacterium]